MRNILRDALLGKGEVIEAHLEELTEPQLAALYTGGRLLYSAVTLELYNRGRSRLVKQLEAGTPPSLLNYEEQKEAP